MRCGSDPARWRRGRIWAAYVGNFAGPEAAIDGNVSILISVGTTATHGGGQGDQVVGEPGAVLDRVDPGSDESWEGVLAEDMRGHATPSA